jgi:multidrug transporter EmrE-like cation transporter
MARIRRYVLNSLALQGGHAVAVIGYFLFGEALGTQKIAALGLICGGVLLLATAA